MAGSTLCVQRRTHSRAWMDGLYVEILGDGDLDVGVHRGVGGYRKLHGM